MLEQRAKVTGHAGPSQQGMITGSVTGFDGEPVAGACVTAVGGGHSVTTAAASDGIFRLPDLAAGSYALEYRDCAAPGRYLTTWSGGVSWQSAAARVQVAAGQVRSVPVVTLRPVNAGAAVAARQAAFRAAIAADNGSRSAAAAAKTGRISGLVTGNGKALRGICVEALPVKTGRFYAAKTTKNGTYTMHKVVAGRYHVVFAPVEVCSDRANWLQQVYKDDNNLFAAFTDSGSVVTVTAGHATSGISGDLRVGGQISGTVTGKSGAKARGICVAANAKFPRGKSFGYFVRTATNGSYVLHALFPARYTLHFEVGCGSGSENYAPTSHATVKLGLGQHLTVNQVLPTGASITGTVTVAPPPGSTSASPPVTGTPVKGICVFVSNVSGSIGAFASTNASGGYRVVGLTGGTYQLQFTPGCPNNGNYTSASLTTHTTAGQQTSNANAVLQVGAEISGTITDSHGNPVSGICVEIDGDDTAGSYAGFDNKGSYLIDQLPAGTYQVGFFGGCGNSGSYAPWWYNDQASESTATSFSLAIAANFPVNPVLQPGATITGKVTTSTGKVPQPYLCVEATTVSGADLGLGFEGLTITRHNTYTLSNLAPGQYLIDFTCPFGDQQFAEQWYPDAPDAGAADLVSAPAGVTSGISTVLRAAGSISGVVTGKGGHPLRGVCVTAVNTKGALPGVSASGLLAVGGFSEFGLPTSTGTNGYYRIEGLAAGHYQVSFSPCYGALSYAEQWYRGKSSPRGATDVTVRAGKITTGIGGRLVVGGSVSGRVTGAGSQPLRDICVIAMAGPAGPSGAAVTGRAGTYTIGGLDSGRYTVAFSPCGDQNLVTVTKSARVTAPHATSGVNATLQAGGSIAGTVTAGSAAVAETCVEVYSGSSAALVGFAYTSEDGSYLATGLPAGSYTVYFNDPLCLIPPPGLAPQWYNGTTTGSGTQGTAQLVPVTVGATTPSIDAALQPDGEITGTVSGPSASALPGVCVTAFPLTASVPLPVVAVTSVTGYSLTDLLPGQYKVRFSAGCGATGYKTQWYKGKGSRAAAASITVGANQDIPDISAMLSKSS